MYTNIRRICGRGNVPDSIGACRNDYKPSPRPIRLARGAGWRVQVNSEKRASAFFQLRASRKPVGHDTIGGSQVSSSTETYASCWSKSLTLDNMFKPGQSSSSCLRDVWSSRHTVSIKKQLSLKFGW